MGSLTDRQYQSYRRIRPGVRDADRKLEEHAVAVVGPDGETITRELCTLVGVLIREVRRTNRLLEVVFKEEVGLDDTD